MGDHVVAAQAKEITGRFVQEMQALIEKLTAEKADLEARLAQEQEARRAAEEMKVEYRRFAEQLSGKLFNEELDLEFWETFRPEEAVKTAMPAEEFLAFMERTARAGHDQQ